MGCSGDAWAQEKMAVGAEILQHVNECIHVYVCTDKYRDGATGVTVVARHSSET